MATKEINVQRFSVTSSKDFRDVVAALEAAIGHPDMNSFSKELGDAGSFAEVERIVDEATGPGGLMEFMRMDLGAVLRKRNGSTCAGCRVVRARDDSGRRAFRWRSPVIRQDG